MKVILLLAGQGTRFLPLSETVPKPLIRVGGTPVLSHILATLEHLVFDELIVVTGHLSDQIEAHLRATYSGAVRIVQQGTLNGTGGAVYAARAHIDCPILIIFGDTIVEADLSELNNNQAGNILWTREVEDYQRFGIVQTDANGHMLQIVEKPQVDVGHHANIGLYHINGYQAFLTGLDDVMAGPATKGEYFLTYAFNHMALHGELIEVRNVEGWYDCGTLSSILATNQHLLTTTDQPALPCGVGVTIIEPVRIASNVHLQDCRIGPNVTLGNGCSVRSSTLQNTIIGDNCVLDGADVKGSLVGDGETLTDLKIQGCIAANGKFQKAT